ncbi:alpha/beta hydrolase [Humidesulfovibrio idahonensis]
MTRQPLHRNAVATTLQIPVLLAVFALALALSGCAPRPGAMTLVPVPAAAAAPRQITVFVATTRAPEDGHEGSYCSKRSRVMQLARYVIAIPPTHKPANIEWPKAGKTPDPATDFAIASYTALSEQELLDALAKNDGSSADSADDGMPAPGAVGSGDKPMGKTAALAAKQTPTTEQAPALAAKLTGANDAAKAGADSANGRNNVDIFVHGYNTNFPEALFRMAQLVVDNPDPISRALLFSWPSDGELSGYVADKDGATFSRDQLAALLEKLAADRRLGDINVAAHSMGCWLTMESLRQLRLTGKDKTLSRLGSVILAAPDIDLDVFQSQVEALGPLDPPLTVLASPDDRALSLSNRLGGDRARMGNLDARDPRIAAMAQAEKFQIIDISSMSGTDSLNHDRFVGAAASLQKLMSPKISQNPLRKAGAFVLDAAASVLEVPGRIGRAAAEKVQ